MYFQCKKQVVKQYVKQELILVRGKKQLYMYEPKIAWTHVHQDVSNGVLFLFFLGGGLTKEFYFLLCAYL
jgi:hypothetical protein